MHFQFGIVPNSSNMPPVPPAAPESVPELLRQILDLQRHELQQLLEVQKEHLDHARAARQEHAGRSHYILSRWGEDYPEFAPNCQKAYPLMERAYIQLLVNMVEELAETEDGMDNEFAVQAFIDRYGMKLGQLQHLLAIVGPISEAARQAEEAKQQQG